ncbi:hypothetical protein yinte0001_11910 [Yersinia intermedia ATCC 29909]|nr:hypothetical protein yinte0001_11910 [Yersinia intermedia ATCC 29909]
MVIPAMRTGTGVVAEDKNAEDENAKDENSFLMLPYLPSVRLLQPNVISDNNAAGQRR